MARREIPGRVLFVLVLLFFVGFAVNVLAWLDVEYFNYVLRTPGATAPGNGGEEPDGPSNIEAIKQSILNVRVQSCEGEEWSTGTGFVVKAGYVATAAHVVAENQACGNEILLVDNRGLEHPGRLTGYSDVDDLAILSIDDTSFVPLEFADSTLYEETDEVVPVVTIGYPLLGTASSAEEAAISGEGNISHFDSGKNLFITSGLNLNPGNSGGPIFLRSSWTVLGVAVKKVDVTVGEGLGIAVPSQRFAGFFRDETGQDL